MPLDMRSDDTVCSWPIEVMDKTNIPEYSFAHATAKELPTDFVQVVEFAFRGEKNMKIAAVMIREGWSMKQVADTLKDLVTLLETE